MRRIFARLIGTGLLMTGVLLAGCDSADPATSKLNGQSTPPVKPTEPKQTKLPIDPG
jgi:hypothetical protein